MARWPMTSIAASSRNRSKWAWPSAWPRWSFWCAPAAQSHERSWYDPIEIPTHEQGVVRIFQIEFEDKARSFTGEDVANALHARQLDLNFVDILSIKDLGEIGLSGYLAEGIDVKPEMLAAHGVSLAR